MNKREAWLAAADFIEKNPERYDYRNGRLPRGIEGETACIWGWTGHFLGGHFDTYSHVSEHCGQTPFLYMDHMYAAGEDCMSPVHAVKFMRRVADEWFPPKDSIQKFDPTFLVFLKSIQEHFHDQVT